MEVRTGTKGRLIASLTRSGEYWILSADGKTTLRSDYADGLRALLSTVSPATAVIDPNDKGMHAGDVRNRAGDLYPRDVVNGTEGAGRPWRGARHGQGRSV
jgi:hypothetical protein